MIQDIRIRYATNDYSGAVLQVSKRIDGEWTEWEPVTVVNLPDGSSITFDDELRRVSRVRLSLVVQ